MYFHWIQIWFFLFKNWSVFFKSDMILFFNPKNYLYFSNLIFLKTQNWFVFSLNTNLIFFFNSKTYLYFLDLIFFKDSKLICIFIKHISDIFILKIDLYFSNLIFLKTQNWSVFSLNTDLIFFKLKIDMYFHWIQSWFFSKKFSLL